MPTCFARCSISFVVRPPGLACALIDPAVFGILGSPVLSVRATGPSSTQTLHDTVLRGRKLMKNLFRLALFGGSAWVVVESAKALAVF